MICHDVFAAVSCRRLSEKRVEKQLINFATFYRGSARNYPVLLALRHAPETFACELEEEITLSITLQKKRRPEKATSRTACSLIC